MEEVPVGRVCCKVLKKRRSSQGVEFLNVLGSPGQDTQQILHKRSLRTSADDRHLVHS